MRMQCRGVASRRPRAGGPSDFEESRWIAACAAMTVWCVLRQLLNLSAFLSCEIPCTLFDQQRGADRYAHRRERHPRKRPQQWHSDQDEAIVATGNEQAAPAHQHAADEALRQLRDRNGPAAQST